MSGSGPREAELRRLLTTIESDRLAIQALVEEVTRVVGAWEKSVPRVEVAGVALALHHVYTAAEHTFEKIAEVIDGTTYRGEARELLHAMGTPIPEVRDRVLTEQTLRQLDELRGFRHVVRHGYEYELNAERVKALASELPNLQRLLQRDLERFKQEVRARIAALEEK